MRTLRLLIVEDSQEDATLIEREVVAAGYQVESRCVSDEADLRVALVGPEPELVLIDDVPGFPGREALAVVRDRWPDVPAIMISGHVGEDGAAALLRAGASEVVHKTDLSRLGATVGGVLHAVERRQARDEARCRQMIETANEGVWEMNGRFRTQQRQAGQALQESEEKYRLLVESANEAICIAQDGALRFVNGSLCEMSGFTREELLARPFAELVHPEDRGFVIAHHLARLAGDEVPELYDFRFVTKGGEVRWAQNNGVVIDWQGRPATLDFFLDVTERRRAEKESGLKSAALEAAANAILIINQGGVVLWVNPAFSQMTGFRFGDVVGRPLCEIQRNQTESGEGEGIWAAMAAGRLWHGVAQAQHRDGSRYIEETTLTPVTDAGGEVTHFIAIKDDVTDRYRASERQRAQLEVQQTLMNAMPNPVFYKDIEEHIRRGAQLTRQLLLFSHRETVKPEHLDLEEVVAGTMGLLRRLLRENVRLQAERIETPIPILADRSQVEQVVVNLALNGADAMPDGGRLVVRTGVRPDGAAWLEVEDTGSGIAEDVRPRIFEPFFTTKGSGRGSGLGLAVVDGIVSQLGGSIELETQVGRGSLFRIVLPRMENPVGSGDDASLLFEGQMAKGHGERVLVIEDEPGARKGLEETLTLLAYAVTTAATGEEALALPVEPPMDAVLSDLVLPGLGGLDVVRQLHDRWQSLAIILMSGYTDDSTVQRQVMDGSIRFLQKPFDARAIARELAAALAERREGTGRGT